MGESRIPGKFGDSGRKGPGHWSRIRHWSLLTVPGAFGNKPCSWEGKLCPFFHRMVRGPGRGNLNDIWIGCSFSVTPERVHHACQVPPSPKHRSFQKGKYGESALERGGCEEVPGAGCDASQTTAQKEQEQKSTATHDSSFPSLSTRDPRVIYNSPSTRPPHRASTATSPSLPGSGFSKGQLQSTSEPLGRRSCDLPEQRWGCRFL